MGKSGDDEPGFSFTILTSVDNFKKWARKMQYFLESTGLWDQTLSDTEYLKSVLIILKGEDLEDDAKLEHQE